MLALFLTSQALVLLLIHYNSEASPGSRNWFFSRDPEDIGFYLYPNPANPEEFTEIKYLNKTSLAQSGYKGNLPLVILIHGLVANRSTAADVRQIKDAYLSVNFPANILMIDYGELAGAMLPGYLSVFNLPVSLFANFNAPIVGQRVAEFISFLTQNGVLDGPHQIHLVGFSLGCHVSAAAGSAVKTMLSAPIDRISGLDCPGGQGQFPSSVNLLDKSDAIFVDITHTSLGRLSGALGQIGHVDFFMNGGGPRQPICNPLFLRSDPYCAHVSSVYYFAKSIRNSVPACQCVVCQFYFSNCPAGNEGIYGQNVSRSATGKYYVRIS